MAVISFKCPNCDGELIFDPSTQKYKCEYCFSLFSQEELDAMKPSQTTEPQNADAAGAGKASGKPEDKKQSQPGNKAGSGTEKDNTENKESDKEAGKEADAVTYTCPSCGAQIVTDATTAATFCYYCHNPVVLGGRLEGKFLPDQVIPFAVSREDAEKGFKDYVCKKKFVPSLLQQKAGREHHRCIFSILALQYQPGGKNAGRGEKCPRVANRKHGIYGDKVLSGIKRR